MKGLNTENLKCILKNTKYFYGIFSRDNLPKFINTPFAIIINTDKSDGPGEHWVSVYVNSEKNGEYFDSYGLKPLYIEIEMFLIDNCVSCTFNNIFIQNPSINSFTCGYYNKSPKITKQN